jgi:hypothetical protein
MDRPAPAGRFCFCEGPTRIAEVSDRGIHQAAHLIAEVSDRGIHQAARLIAEVSDRGIPEFSQNKPHKK